MNLKYGIPNDCSELTCTAGVGTLMLEFGILGKLIGDPRFELVARKALNSLWRFRSNSTGLFGKYLKFHCRYKLSLTSALFSRSPSSSLRWKR